MWYVWRETEDSDWLHVARAFATKPIARAPTMEAAYAAQRLLARHNGPSKVEVAARLGSLCTVCNRWHYELPGECRGCISARRP